MIVLDQLAEAAAVLARAGRPLPEIELALASGHTLRGRLVSCDGRIAILTTAGGSQTHARVDQVVATTVADPAVLARRAPDGPVPSRLELARRAEAAAATLGRRVQVPGDLDDDGRRAAGTALALLADLIPKIARDDLGAQALASIETIEVTAGPDTVVERRGSTLVVAASRVDAPTSAGLRREIERVL